MQKRGSSLKHTGTHVYPNPSLGLATVMTPMDNPHAHILDDTRFQPCACVCRNMEICDRVRSALGPRCHACVISSAPVGIHDSSSALVRRSACKNVRQSALSARGLQRAKRAAESSWEEGGMRAGGAVMDAAYLEEVEVCVCGWEGVWYAGQDRYLRMPSTRCSQLSTAFDCVCTQAFMQRTIRGLHV